MINSWAMKAILGLVLVFIISIGFFVLRNGKVSSTSNNDQYLVNPNSANVKMQSGETKSNQTDNYDPGLATYKNEKYGFEFKYPNFWKIVEPSSCDTTLGSLCHVVELWSPKNFGDFDTHRKSGTAGEATSPDISIYYYKSLQDIPNVGKSETLEQYMHNKFFSDIQVINLLNGKAWFAVQSDFTNFYTIFTEQNGHIYQIAFLGNSFDLPMSPNKMTDIEKKLISHIYFSGKTANQN